MLHEGSCARRKAAAAPQFAIGRRKALQQGWGAKSQLKIIQRDGYDTDTDVRDSLEVQEVEKEHDEARKLRHSRTRRRDKFIKL